MEEKKTLREHGLIINRRKWLTLEKKLAIIKLHESGKTYAKIARENGMNESSIRSILRRKEQYKEQAKLTATYLSNVVTRQRSSLINATERTLVAWIEECNEKSLQLTESDIQKKALAIFNELKEQDGRGTKEKFAASRGWFYRFKSRVNLQNPVNSGEKSTPDEAAAESFCTEFRNIVQEGGYSKQQIFNVAETVLYWKRLPSKTFLAEGEKSVQGYKPSKDTLTVFLGGNASGDLKFVPLVVFRAETPSALRSCEKTSLPVIWRSSKKAWLTRAIFQDWFSNYFCPTVEKYCSEMGIEFKVLLVLDSAPKYVPTENKNVRIVYLSLNTETLIQPMGQGIFSTFKACYMRQILSQAIEASTTMETLPLPEFWKNYNIKNAVHNVSASWNEISVDDMISVWHRMLPDVKTKDFESQVQAIAQDIVTMGKYFGFESLDIPNVQNCIESILDDSEDQSIEMEQAIVCKEELPDEYEDEFGESENGEINLDNLEKIFQGVDAACETILAADLDIERSIKVRQVLQNGIQCYRDLYFEKKKNKDSYFD